MLDKCVYEAMWKCDLTQDQIDKALRTINVIKEKHDDSLKGRHCADGSLQKGQYEKHETSSPALSADALFLTLLVDAAEGRDVGTADIVGAYLNAFMDELVILCLTGEDVDLMCDVSPEFAEYVEYKNGRKVLYL